MQSYLEGDEMAQELLIQTGSQTVGPFFHDALLVGGENILVSDKTAGLHIMIEGAVYDGDGAPVPDALIEIWQPDAQGIFNHPADPNHAQADPAFRGFGRADTVNDGHYSFRTVKPGAIAGADGQQAAPYINVRVFARGLLIHAVTRLYFSDESANQSDPVLSALAPRRRQTLIAQQEDSSGLPRYRFDIRLQGEDETVFFDL
jgi:protocatechuate 3,4-dioxygenase alpha subunit